MIKFNTPLDQIVIKHYDSCGFVIEGKIRDNQVCDVEITDEDFQRIGNFVSSRLRAERVLAVTDTDYFIAAKKVKDQTMLIVYKKHEYIGKSCVIIAYAKTKELKEEFATWN